jgi:hypothetical protein
MDIEINKFLKEKSKEEAKKGTKKGTKRGSKKTANQKGGTLGQKCQTNVGDIYVENKFTPLKFSDNIIRYADGKVTQPIINFKQVDKYMISVSNTGGVYVSLPPTKMGFTFEEFNSIK